MFVTRKDVTATDFGSLKRGDVFRDGETIYMSIENIESADRSRYNAVDVETGELAFYYADEKVYPLQAELVVS